MTSASKPGKIAGVLQENVLALCCFSDEHCHTVRNGIPLQLYSNSIFRTIANKAYDFIDAFRVAPKEHLPDLLEENIADEREGRLYSEMVHGLHLLGRDMNVKYVVDQLGIFVQEHSLRVGIIEAAEALQNDDLDGARSVIETALRQTPAPVFAAGTRLSQVTDALRRGELQREVMPCGIGPLDERQIGPARGELWFLLAGPKRGKSWGLINLTRACMIERKRVLYVTLEVSEAIIARRIVQAFTGYSVRESVLKAEDGSPITILPTIVERENEDRKSMISRIELREQPAHEFLTAREGIPPGAQLAAERIAQLRIDDRLLVKAFPTGQLSVRNLVTYLDQLERIERYVPDILILDYADLMSVDEKNYRLSLGNVVKELRGIAVQRNIAVATASQLNRHGAGLERATELHIAEDFSKVAIADTVLVFNQMTVERTFGVGRLYVAASRNEDDRFSILITQNYSIGQFVLAAQPEPWNYNEFLKELRGRERGDDGDDGEAPPEKAPPEPAKGLLGRGNGDGRRKLN